MADGPGSSGGERLVYSTWPGLVLVAGPGGIYGGAIGAVEYACTAVTSGAIGDSGGMNRTRRDASFLELDGSEPDRSIGDGDRELGIYRLPVADESVALAK